MAVSGAEIAGHALTELRQTGTRIPHKIFIGGLAEQTQDSDIRAAILDVNPNCEIQAVQIIHDRSIPTKTNEPRHYAFVEFASEAEVKKTLEMVAAQPEPMEVHGRRWTFGLAYRKAYSGRKNNYQMPGLAMIDPAAYYRLAYAANAANFQKNMPLMPTLGGFGCYPMMPVDYSSLMSPYMMSPYSSPMSPSSHQVVPSNSPYSLKPGMHSPMENGYSTVPMNNGVPNWALDDASTFDLAYKLAAVSLENGDFRGRMNGAPAMSVQQQMDARFVNPSPVSTPLSGDARGPYLPHMVNQFAQ